MTQGLPYDVVIIGGGPSGATAALVLARAGFRTVVLEKEAFPRFHIGESFLPRNYALLQELGLEEPFKRLAHVPKYGVEFGMGDAENAKTTRFTFDQGLVPGSNTFSIERAAFDDMVLREARAAGAEVRERTTVRSILRLAENDVVVDAGGEEIRGRWLFDASGQNTLVGRDLGTRKPVNKPHLQKVAYFEHFENVYRHPGREAGHPLIIMCDEGWFWFIPIDEKRTSIGLVAEPGLIKKAAVPATQMLQWGIARCPLARERTAQASGPDINRVCADFSYTCEPFSGPGYFLLGDAAAFMDPIFSSGVCLGMASGQAAANHVIAVTAGKRRPAAARRQYNRFIRQTTGPFYRLIDGYYEHSFRELFLEGQGPLQVHRAVLSLLAGHVFPRPPWPLRWRMIAFEVFLRLNRRFQIVPPRQRFSLLGNPGAAP